MRGRDRALWVPRVLTGAMFLHTAWVLLGSPVLGLADNGDFTRVMDAAGLRHSVEPGPVPNYVDAVLIVAEPIEGSKLSTTAVVALVAKALGADDELDIRWMGAVYLVLLGAILAGMSWAQISPWWVMITCWVITDPMFVLSFNSLYALAPHALALLAAIFALWAWETKPHLARWWLCVVVPVACCMGALSKPAHVLFGVPLIAIVWPGMRAPMSSRHRVRWASVISMVLITVAALWHFGSGFEPGSARINQYHTVYRGILQLAADPEPIGESLGLPDDYRDWIGRSYFRGPPQHILDQVHTVSRWRVLVEYARHPSATAAAIERSLRMLLLADLGYAGNSASRDRDPFDFTTPWQFERLTRLLAWPTWGWLLFVPGLLWYAVWRSKKFPNTGYTRTLWFLVWTVVLECAVAVIGDGTFSLWRHLMGARLALFLIFGLLLLELGGRIEAWIRSPSRAGWGR